MKNTSTPPLPRRFFAPFLLLPVMAAAAAILFLGLMRTSGSALAQDAGEDEPKKVDVELVNSGEGETEAKPAAETPPPAAKETFSRVVITGLPPTLGSRMEDIGRRLSDVGGVKLQAEWFRVNMACYSSPSPFKGAELATKLGLHVISDVADELILAPADTAEARQAEARLFMLGLVNDPAKAGFWNQLAGSGPDPRRSMPRPSAIIRLNNNVRIGGASDGKVAPVDTGPLIDASKVFSIEGTLDQESVQLAMGFTAEALARPMKHYRLSNFRVGRYSPAQSSGSGRVVRYYYDEYGRTSGQEQKLVITAEAGEQQDNVPTGPGFGDAFDPLIMFQQMAGNLFWRMARIMGGSSSYYSSWSESSSGGTRPSESAQFVAMLLEDFRRAGTPDIDRLAAETDRIRKLRESGAPAEDVRKAVLEYLLANERGSRPFRVTWADRTAVAAMQDAQDDTGPANAAKLEIAKRATKFIQSHYQAKGAAAEWKYGSLGDWELREFYGFPYNHFDVPPYSDYWVNMSKDEDPAYQNWIVITAGGNAPENLRFSMRIEPSSGANIWTMGEPEPAEAVLARRKEIFDAANLLAEAVKANPSATFDSRWIQDQLTAMPDRVWSHVSSMDFEVDRLLPGIYRVHGQALSVAEAQTAVVDTVSGRVTWETPAPKAPKAESSDESEFYLD